MSPPKSPPKSPGKSVNHSKRSSIEQLPTIEEDRFTNMHPAERPSTIDEDLEFQAQGLLQWIEELPDEISSESNVLKSIKL